MRVWVEDEGKYPSGFAGGNSVPNALISKCRIGSYERTDVKAEKQFL